MSGKRYSDKATAVKAIEANGGKVDPWRCCHGSTLHSHVGMY